MADIFVQQKIAKYTLEHQNDPRIKGKAVADIVSIMVQDGILTIAEAEEYKKISLFSVLSLSQSDTDMGLYVQKNQPQKSKRPDAPWRKELRNIAAQNITIAYDRAISIIQSYQGQQGFINVGFWRELLGKGFNKIVPTDKLAFCFEAMVIELEKQKQVAQQELLSCVDDPEEFETKFREITGKAFSLVEMSKFKEASEKQDNDITEEYDKAFGDKIISPVAKKVERQAKVDGVGDIVLMLLGSEIIGKGLAKIFGKPLTQFFGVTTFGRIMTSSTVGGTTLAVWTASSGTVNNLTKKDKSPEDWKNLGIATAESFGFGFVGGVLAETAVSAVVKAIDKPAAKVSQAVSELLAKSEEVTAREIMEAAIKAEQPSIIAKLAGFGTEVAGFTAYTTAEDIIKDICNPETGNLPDDMTLENLVAYLGKSAWGQLKNLGEIKGVAQLLMLVRGGSVGKQAVLNQMLNSEVLKGTKIIPGENGCVIRDSKGHTMNVASADEVMAVCQFLMQASWLEGTKKETKKAEKAEEKSKSQEPKPETEGKPQDAETKGEMTVLEGKSAEEVLEELETANKQTTLQVKLELPEITIENVEDVLRNKKLINKAFSPVQIEHIKYGLEKCPDKLPLIETILSAKGLNEEQIVKLLTSEKISAEDLGKINEYIKVANEQGFDLINLLESTEEDFNKFIEDETQRLQNSQPRVQEKSEIKITKDSNELISYLKHYKVSKRYLEAIKKLKPEEIEKLSGILSVVNIEESKYYFDNCIKMIEFMTPENEKVVKLYAEGYGIYSPDDIKEVTDVLAKKPELIEFTEKFLMYKKELNEYKKQNPYFNNYGYNFLGSGYILRDVVEKLENKQQGECLLALLNSNSYAFIESNFRKMFQLAQIMKNPSDVEDLPKIMQVERYIDSQIVKDYMTLPKEDRALLDIFLNGDKETLKMFDRSNLGSFIIKFLKEPETQPYMKNIMQKVKTIDDMKQLYIIDYCNKSNIPLADKMYADKDFPNDLIVNILRSTHEHNIRLAEKLYADKDFPRDEIPIVLKYTTEQNQDAKIAIYEKLKANSEFPKEEIASILCFVVKHNIQLAEKLCSDKEFPKDVISAILCQTKGYNIQLAEKLCADKDFPKDKIANVLQYTNEKNIILAEKMYADKDFPRDKIANILRCTNEHNIQLAEKLCADKDFPKYMIESIISYTEEHNIQLAEKLCADKDFPKDMIANILRYTEEHNIQLAEKLCADKDFPKDKIANVLQYTNEKNITLAEKLCADKDFPKDMIANILRYAKEYNIQLAEKLCADKDFPKDKIANVLQYTNEKNITLAEKMCSDKDFPINMIAGILQHTNEKNIILAEKMYADKDFPINMIAGILQYTNEKNIILAEKMYADKDFPINMIAGILQYTNEKNITLAEKMCADKDFPRNMIAGILCHAMENNIQLAEKLYADKSIDCPPSLIAKILSYYVEGTDDIIIRNIKDGQLSKYPKLIKYHTDCWDNIIKRDLLNIQKESSSSKELIEAYARSREENIVQLHKQLYEDALANKDILKSGIEDITDQEILWNMYNERTVNAIDLIGLTNVEAAFPLMLEEFTEFINVLNEVKYSDSNRELLLERINPQNSLKSKTLNEEIAQLKKSLNEVVGKDNLAKIRNLQEQKSKVDEQVKQLKQNENADNPEIKEQIKELQKQSKLLGSQAQSIYYQGENAPKIKEIMAQISAKTKELKTLLSANSGLAPQEVVTKMRVLSALTKISTEQEITEFIEMIKEPTPENEAKWNDAVNKKIFQKLDVEYDESLSQKLDLVHCKYISKLFVSSQEFFRNLQKLVTVIKNNPDLTIEQAIDSMPQNIETKRIFEELGFDYEKYTKVDKDSYTSVKIELNAEEAKQMSIHNLEEDLNDALFQSLPKEVTEPIFAALKEQLGVTFVKSQKDNWDSYGFDAGTSEYYRLYKDGKLIEFDDMDKIVSVIKKEINNNDFWTQTNDDAQIENARGTMYTHLIKMRTQEVDNAASIKDGETAEIEVRKTDMYDVKKALGLGNDAQCCTALGRNFNEWSAPTYIANKCIGAIELTDKGSFVGNTMIYLAYVDGKPALVLDNIELKTKYQNNDKIRDTFVDYAKKLCAEIGQPDLPIFAGPNRHKLDMSIYEKTKHSMEIIGSSGSDYVYVDYDAFRHVVGNGEVVDIDMYRLR